jgi:hypothetical protein
MRSYMSVRFVSVIAALALSTTTISNAATIPVVLSGGGSTDGWIAPAAPLLAYNLGTTSSYTIQTVLFKGWAGSLNAPDNGPVFNTTSPNISNSSFSAPSYASPDGNDTAMAGMISEISYSGQNSGAGPLTIIIKGPGLTIGTTYRIDLFTLSGSNRTKERFALNGTQILDFTEVANTSYLVQDFVAAVSRPDLGSGGQITIDVSSGDNLTPVLSGFVVSVATPEPASTAVCLFSAAGIMLARRAGSHRPGVV